MGNDLLGVGKSSAEGAPLEIPKNIQASPVFKSPLIEKTLALAPKIPPLMQEQSEAKIAFKAMTLPIDSLTVHDNISLFKKIFDPKHLFMDGKSVTKELTEDAEIIPKRTVAIFQGKIYGLEEAVNAFIENPPKIVDEFGHEVKKLEAYIISEEDFEPIAKIITENITNYRASLGQKTSKKEGHEKISMEAPQEYSGVKVEKRGTYPRPMEPALIKEKFRNIIQKIIIAINFIKELRAEEKRKEKAKKHDEIEQKVIADDLLKHETIKENIQKSEIQTEINERPLENQ